MKERIRLALGVLLALTVAAAAAALTDGANASPPDVVQAAKAASARFHSIQQAEAAGYVVASPCIESPAGGMGFHYENAGADGRRRDRPGAGRRSSSTRRKRNGELELVAVEYWKRDADGSLMTQRRQDRPVVLGQSVRRADAWSQPGHAGALRPARLWLYETNPSGRFAPFNPAVSC